MTAVLSRAKILYFYFFLTFLTSVTGQWLIQLLTGKPTPQFHIPSSISRGVRKFLELPPTNAASPTEETEFIKDADNW